MSGDTAGSDPTVTTAPDPKAERAARVAAREEARAKAEAERADLLEELADRFDEEIGPRGEAWDMLDLIGGPVAVKIGAGVHFTKYQAAAEKKGGGGFADQQTLVLPCLIYPEAGVYKAACQARPGIADEVAAVLIYLYKGKRLNLSGK